MTRLRQPPLVSTSPVSISVFSFESTGGQPSPAIVAAMLPTSKNS